MRICDGNTSPQGNPWLSFEDNSQHYTLVLEWRRDGGIIQDWRKQLTAEQFEELKLAVNSAKPG